MKPALKHGKWYLLSDATPFDGTRIITHCMQVSGGVVMRNITFTGETSGGVFQPVTSSESTVFIPGNTIVQSEDSARCEFLYTHGAIG